jgi:CHAT domain-containing protein
MPLDSNAAIAESTTWSQEFHVIFLEHQQLVEANRLDEALDLALKGLALAEQNSRGASLEKVTALELLASTYVSLGAYDKAVSIQERDADMSIVFFGEGALHVGHSLRLLGEAYLMTDKPSKAIPVLRRAAAILETQANPVEARLDDVYAALAQASRQAGDLEQSSQFYAESIKLNEKALKFVEDARGVNHPMTTPILESIAVAYLQEGRYDDALSIERRVLAIKEAAFGKDSTLNAVTLSNISMTLKSMGDFDEAKQYAERALAIQQRTFGHETLQAADAMIPLAQIHAELGNYDDAVALDKEVLEIEKTHLGPKHRKLSLPLGDLAYMYLHQGEYQAAIDARQQEWAILEANGRTDGREAAMSFSQMAQPLSMLGEYEQAMPLQQRALAILSALIGEDHPDTLIVASDLAHTYLQLGRYDDAIKSLENTVALTEKRLGVDHPAVASDLDILGQAYLETGFVNKAISAHSRALLIQRSKRGERSEYVARSLNNLAYDYSVAGDNTKAIALERQAITIQSAVLGDNHPSTAIMEGVLGSFLLASNQAADALVMTQRALATIIEAVGVQHPTSAKLMEDLGNEYTATGESDLAIFWFKQAINIQQGQRERVAQLGDKDLRAFTLAISSPYQKLASVLVDAGRLSEAQTVLDMLKESEQFDFIRRSPDQDPRHTLIDFTSHEAPWVDRFKVISGGIIAASKEKRDLEHIKPTLRTPEQRAQLVKIDKNMGMAQQAFAVYTAELRAGLLTKQGEASSVVAELSGKNLADLQGLLARLGDGTVLVQYYLLEDRLGILVTTPTVQLARTVRLSASELARRINRFRMALRDPHSILESEAKALYDLLVGPIRADLEQAQAKNVMLSLDGDLRYLPFAALHDEQGYLVDRFDFPLYSPISRMHIEETSVATWRATAFGVSRGTAEFSALPSVETEIHGIIRHGGTGVMEGMYYLNGDFTASRLKTVGSEGLPVIHIASHFKFSPGTEANSFLLLGDGGHLTLGDIRRQNYRFDNVELLTLSACETALGGGRDARGNEVEGFGVIAQGQGAKAVLASLWPVADQSTALLMADLYKRMTTSKMTKAEALRQAEIGLRKDPRYSHPYYWAPFVLMGNWQ